MTVQLHLLWLPWIAQHLVVEDRLHAVDVIAVFATAEVRARHAARLYGEGLAPRLLVTGGVMSKEIELFCGARVTGAELSASMLTAAGVPERAVIVLPHGTSTYEEAEAIKVFMETQGYRALIAISSPGYRNFKRPFAPAPREYTLRLPPAPPAGGHGSPTALPARPGPRGSPAGALRRQAERGAAQSGHAPQHGGLQWRQAVV